MKTMKRMQTGRIVLFFSLFLSVMFVKADILSTSLYEDPKAGTYYLYNIEQGQFLQRLSNNFPGLTSSPAEVVLTDKGSGYTIMFADGKFLKTGFWNNQYLWTDGGGSDAEAIWTFQPISGKDKVFQLKRSGEDTWNSITGTYYANGTNADTAATSDCQWALISLEKYVTVAKGNSIPTRFRSDVPLIEGQYYLYDVLNHTFLNTTNRTLSNEPKSLVTLTPSGSSFLISGDAGKYLKIGVYKGQYLWSDGVSTSTKWTIESPSGAEAEKLYYIYTNDFTETNAEVNGKTMYLNETNATSAKPFFARWALISESDYVDFLSSGEGAVDAAVVATNKATILQNKGDATSLLQNPTFDRSSDGWWGGERALCQLYRGSGYAYEASEDGSVMLQTIMNMPKGTYKVVAAVRGVNGTYVSARLADNFGNPVINRGANAVCDQLNMNGVKTPYSAIGDFNKSENSQGWDWVTAEGTLTEDGHLKIEFVTEGTGKVSVADVQLYYMNDGENVYAVEYEDGVDATAHAITCDLTTDNPNTLFLSNGAITTISGAKLNNNLVGGTVSKLVLCDGYEFKPTTDFIATKATYYCNIEAGVPTAVCMPFAISRSTSGVFYDVVSKVGNVLKMQEVSKLEAGKTYIYYPDDDMSLLTGSGNIKFTPIRTELLSLIDGFGVSSVEDNSDFVFDYDDDEDAIWKKPQVVISDLMIGYEGYLYNVKAGRFYTEGNSYGTQASIGDTGLKVKFVQNGEAVKLTNYSNVANAWRTTFFTTNGAMFVDGDVVTECNWMVVPGSDKTFKLMMSAPNASYNQENYPGAMMGLDFFESNLPTNLAALLFADEEPGEGIYLTDWGYVAPSSYNTYQTAVATYKTALQLKDLLAEAKSQNIDVTTEQTVYENTESTQEELTAAIVSLTNKMIEDELGTATRENPLDLTENFITNPSYENNDNEGWSGNTPTIDVANNLQNAEFFNTNFNCYQDLVGLPNGYYRVSVQAFYRAGLEGPALEAKQSGNEDSYLNAYLYVVADNKTITSKVQSIFTGAPTTSLGVSGEINNGGWWVPNTMASAAAYFAAGYFKENSIEIQVTNGTLRIGMRKSTTIRRDWVMLDNWKIEYLGEK